MKGSKIHRQLAIIRAAKEASEKTYYFSTEDVWEILKASGEDLGVPDNRISVVIGNILTRVWYLQFKRIGKAKYAPIEEAPNTEMNEAWRG